MGRFIRILRGRPAGGFTAHSVLLSILLVVATSGAVVLVMVQVIGGQVERAADRRLADGSTRFEDTLASQRRDLHIAGAWLSADPAFVRAVAEQSGDGTRGRLEAVMPSHLFADAEVTDPAGEALAAVRDENSAQSLATALSDDPAAADLRAALAGRQSSRVAVCGPELLCQQLLLPVPAPGGGAPVGALRLVATFGSDDLKRFGTTNGYEASVFDGTRRLMTTLRHPDGTPLTDIGTSPEIYRQVTAGGGPVSLWRDTPAGRVRTLFLPLRADDGSVVGMYSLAVPETAIAGAWHAAVLTVLPITLIVIAIGAQLAWLLSRAVRRPILALGVAATRLGQGDLDTPIPSVGEPVLRPLAEQLEQARRGVRERVEALANEQARRRALFAALREPVLVADTAGRVIELNQAARALFGARANAESVTLHDLLPFVSEDAEVRNADAPGQGTIVEPGGRAIEIDVGRTLLPGGPAPDLEVYVLHDVSRHAELNRMRRQLLHDVAHELRGPLTVLENALEILSTEYAELSAAEFGRLTGSATRTAARLRTLMEDLLNAGTIESGRLQMTRQPTALSTIFQEAVEAVRQEIHAREQRFELVIDPDLEPVDVDGRYIRQALINLLGNASKFTPPGGVIRLRASWSLGQARISVEDNGPGIPAEHLPRVFERFYRADATARQPGAGLGLAIARDVVEAHGGQIGVESTPGEGTTIWLTLPVARKVVG